MNKQQPFKSIGRLFRLIYTSFIGFIAALINPFVQIFKGKTAGKKIGGILYYTVLILLFIFFRPGFFIALGFLFFIVVFTTYPQLKKSWETLDKVDSKIHDIFHNVPTDDTEDLTLYYFFGKSPEEAKKEYRELLKKYHPDNPGGSVEKTTRITEAYEYYQLDRKKND